MLEKTKYFNNLLDEGIRFQNVDKFIESACLILDFIETEHFYFPIINYFEKHLSDNSLFFQIFFNKLGQLSQTNSASIFFLIALCFDIGIGTQKNAEKAFEFYSHPVLDHHSISLNIIGYFYDGGIGVEQNSSQAFLFYLKAASLNYPGALINVGICYFEGIYVKKDHRKVFAFYLKAANLNHPKALYNVGTCYFYGIGVERNWKKGFGYYSRSADLNHPLALVVYAVYLLTYENKYDEVFRYLKNRTEENFVQRNFWFGFCLINGFGTPKKILDGLDLICEITRSYDFLVAHLFLSVSVIIKRRFS